jgi:hypothetical protein
MKKYNNINIAISGRLNYLSGLEFDSTMYFNVSPKFFDPFKYEIRIRIYYWLKENI